MNNNKKNDLIGVFIGILVMVLSYLWSKWKNYWRIWIMYKIELEENGKVLISKEFSKYDDIIQYSNELLKQIKLNRKIIIYEMKNDKWIKFGEWKMR